MKRVVALSGVVFGAVTKRIVGRELVHCYSFWALDGFCIRSTFADIAHPFAAFGDALSAGIGEWGALDSIALFIECTFVDLVIFVIRETMLNGSVGNGIDRRMG